MTDTLPMTAAARLGKLSDEQFAAAYASIMEAAREVGVSGFSGECWATAVAINRVIFGGQGELVAGLNCALQAVGVNIGHAAVGARGAFWDADGRPKEASDIDSWGMLDREDSELRATFRQAGVRWSARAAETGALYAYDGEDEFLDAYGLSHRDIIAIESILEQIANAEMAPATAPVFPPGPW